MTTFDLNTLHAFIIRAKAATYVGSGQKLLPYRLGSHDLQFVDGDWAYHDSYLGESDFIGEEIVYYQRQVVWGMNYFGVILQPDRISSAQAGHVIKVSLTRLYQEGRFPRRLRTHRRWPALRGHQRRRLPALPRQRMDRARGPDRV